MTAAPNYQDLHALVDQLRPDQAHLAERHEEIIREGLAERLGLREVATLDHRHFRVVRPRHVPAFDLLP
ncbi:hypothetical protein AB0B89_34245 [Sphaerisporangium sp. NPDC049002]|uniref:hypothetical protein n=1 Tax=Sphaerisporangium sp. NPDC049002 TaxID=3155392 RepID=UPI0033C640BE